MIMRDHYRRGVAGSTASRDCGPLPPLAGSVSLLPMRAYVTGGHGFVGQRLAPALEARGWTVEGCDRAVPEVDITDPAKIAAAFQAADPEAVIHLAAQSSVARSFEDPLSTFRVNFLGTLNVLRAVSTATPQARVLMIGSADQYGGQQLGDPPLSETAPLAPKSPYARTKTAGELLGLQEIKAGRHLYAVRSFNHTGPGQADHFVAPSFARQLAEIASGQTEPTMKVGNLASVRDFLHVDDVIDAYATLLGSDAAPGVYNIASGEAHAIQELLDGLIAASGARVQVEVDPDLFRPTDQLLGDPSRLHEATGWAPTHAFGDIAVSLMDDWRQRIAS